MQTQKRLCKRHFVLPALYEVERPGWTFHTAYRQTHANSLHYTAVAARQRVSESLVSLDKDKGRRAFESQHTSCIKWSKYCLCNRATKDFFWNLKNSFIKKCINIFFFLIIYTIIDFPFPSATPLSYLHLQYVCIFPNLSIKNSSILQTRPFLIKESLWDWTLCASVNV